MEENIKITLLNQEITISLNNILQFKPLIKDDILKMIQIPYLHKKFIPNIEIFNICLYYLIVVDKNLDQIKESHYRDKCLGKISQYYIVNRMNFQLYEYGILAAKILLHPLDKTLHILYFLVYGRLASKPYINNMIYVTEKKNIQRRKRHKIKPDVQVSHRKSQDSRHFTVFCQSNQYQADQFKRQLKNVFNTTTNNVQLKKTIRKVQNKRYFNVKKIYPDQFEERYQSSLTKGQSQYRNCVSSIPLKVSAFENSSVMAKITKSFQQNKFKKTNIKKIHVRKQKFHENISQYDKFYEQLLKEDYQKQRRQAQAIRFQKAQKQNKQQSKNNKKYNKFPYEYYKKIVGRIKTKNDELDLIRNECTHHSTARNTPQHHSPFNYSKINRFALLRTQHQNKTSNLLDDYKKQEENLFIGDICLDDFNQSFIGEIIKNSNKNSHLQKNRLKTVKIALNSQNNVLAQSFKGQTINYATITRKNDKFYQDLDEKDGMHFTKNLKNKFKLQKYKKQYKQFLKTQMFQKQSKQI